MIKVGFSTKHHLLSSFIRWVTKSECSHTWLLIEDPLFGTTFVVEASEFGYRFVSWDRFQKANVIVALLEPEVSLEVGIRQAGKWVGEAYDVGGLFGTLFPIVGRWLKKKWRNPWASSKAMFCSEAVTRILQLSKYPGSEKLIPESTVPQDLLVFLRSPRP